MTGLPIEAGTMAEGGLSSPDPHTVSKVIVTVRMLIVPYQSMYSLGVEVEELACGDGVSHTTSLTTDKESGGAGKKARFKFSLRRRKTTDN